MVSVVLSISDKKYADSESVAIIENHIYLEDVVLSHVSVNDGSYSVVRSESAYLDRGENTVLLNDTSLEFVDNINNFKAQADRGRYMLDKRFEATGNIHGRWNDMSYSLEKTGTFEYDFTSRAGVLTDNVTFVKDGQQPGPSIRADKVKFDTLSKEIAFEGNVKMVYTGDISK